MAKVNLEKMSLAELNQLAKDVAKAVRGYEAKQRAKALKEIQAIAKKHGVSLGDIVGGTAGKKAAKKPGKKRGKVAPKYRNPDDAAQTWTGRGRQPLWFKAAIEAGTTPDDMAI